MTLTKTIRVGYFILFLRKEKTLVLIVMQQQNLFGKREKFFDHEYVASIALA